MIKIKGGYEKVDLWALSGRLILAVKEFHKTLDNDMMICIHCGVEGQHSATGFHPKGMAIDVHFEKFESIVQPAVVIHHLLRYWQGGIGVYTNWNNPGFHLDVGPIRTWWKNDNSGEVHTLAEYIKQSGLEGYV